jgi:broad specificity phosphatase PhoE
MLRSPFYAMRHGETSWNAQARFQGHSDVPLSVKGTRQMLEIATRLREILVRSTMRSSTVRIFSSPLARARESARILCGELGFRDGEIIVDERLREMSFGRWEGLTTYEVKERFSIERRARKLDRWNFRPDGGESFADLSAAMEAFLRDIPNGCLPLIVTHTGNIRVTLRLLAGTSCAKSMRAPIPHDRILRWDGNRTEWI